MNFLLILTVFAAIPFAPFGFLKRINKYSFACVSLSTPVPAAIALQQSLRTFSGNVTFGTHWRKVSLHSYSFEFNVYEQLEGRVFRHHIPVLQETIANKLFN